MFSKNWGLCLPLAAGMVLAACEGEDGRPVYTTYDKTIWETMKGNSELSTFVERGTPGGVESFLDKTQATFTVLAPSNSAFSAATGLSDDPVKVNYLLRFHSLAGWIDTALLKLGGEFNTVTATTVLVDVEGSTYEVFDYTRASATLTTTDIFCKNGVIHIIDKVLTPPDNVAVLNSEGFTSFIAAVQGTSVEARLNGPDDTTVLAPNNEALATFGSLAEINAKVRETILLNHFVPGRARAADVPGLTTLANVELDEPPFGASIDHGTINGMVHEVTAVVTPPTAIEYVTALTKKTGKAAKAAGDNIAELDPDVLGPAHAAPITIFAPNDKAWTDAMIDPAGTTTSTLTFANILLAHSTADQRLLSDLTNGATLTMLNGSVATFNTSDMETTLTVGTTKVKIDVANSDHRTLTGVVHVVEGLLDKDATPN